MISVPRFAIDEWLVCPTCGVVCDAPFLPVGSDATEPTVELVLGQSLPESEAVPTGDWRTEVTTLCPTCGSRLVALALFEGRVLREFAATADA